MSAAKKKTKKGKRAPLARAVSKRGKAKRGPTAARKTTLRLHGSPHTPALARHARAAFGRKLGKFARQITRVDVHLAEPSARGGAPSTACRAVVSLATRDPITVEHRAETARAAIDGAADRVERAVRRELGKSATTVARKPRAARSRTKPKRAKSKRARGKVDTSLPGVSATDKKVGKRDTAVRNVSERARRKGGAALESSATGRPSRKSTRGSEGAHKRTSNLKLRELARRRAPTTRAAKARAKKR